MNEIIDWFGGSIWTFIDALVTMFTLWLVFNNWRNSQKQLEPIKLFIEKEGIIKEIPTYIIRRNFTRSDIKGILKELHESKEDFKIKDIIQADFLKKIFEIQQGNASELVIKIIDTDFFVYEMK
jgi:hypothetical protein